MIGAKDAKEFQERVLFEAGVAILPSTSFGKRNEGETQEYVRFSYATSRENIMKGIDKIEDFMKKNMK